MKTELADVRKLAQEATEPQCMYGENWGSGDAKTFFFIGQKALEKIAQTHWQDNVWFRQAPGKPWVKASGFIALSIKEQQERGDQYFWNQEKLSRVWEQHI